MTLTKQQAALWLLRIALATVFLFAAVSSILSPNDWVGYLPKIATLVVPAAILLKIFAVYEFGLAAWLLSGLATRYAAALSALTLAGIVASNFGLFAISFRDIGLALAAVALALLA